MIDKLKDINDIITSRFNNVIIGSFLTSFFMMNSRGLAIFSLSDNATRIKILRGWEIDYAKDILIPILLIVFYVAVIPIISITIKKYITNRIYKEEQDVERSRLLISLNGMQDVAIATAKSTTEYAEKYVDNEIKQWVEERENNLSALDLARNKNINLEQSNKELEVKNKELATNESNHKSASAYYSMLYDRCIGSINNISTVINDINSTHTASLDIKKRFGENSIEWHHYLTQQIIGAIRNIVEVNNNQPTTTHGDWKKPIDTTLTRELSSLATSLEQDKTKRDAEMRRMEAVINEAKATAGKIPNYNVMQGTIGAAGKIPTYSVMQDTIGAAAAAGKIPNYKIMQDAIGAAGKTPKYSVMQDTIGAAAAAGKIPNYKIMQDAIGAAGIIPKYNVMQDTIGAAAAAGKIPNYKIMQDAIGAAGKTPKYNVMQDAIGAAGKTPKYSVMQDTIGVAAGLRTGVKSMKENEEK